MRICIETNSIDDSRTYHTWIKKNYPFIDHINILSIKLYPKIIIMCQPYWLLEHTSNNLPLGLKPIDHKSKCHLLKVDFHFRLAQLPSQQVCHVVYGVYSSHLDMFLFEIVTYVVISPLDVLWLYCYRSTTVSHPML